MPNIPQSTEKIIQKFIDRVNKLLGKRVKKIILYGSYARGDYNGNSDIDIMILTDLTNEEIIEYRELVSNIAFDIEFDTNFEVMISPLVKNIEKFEYWLKRITILYECSERRSGFEWYRKYLQNVAEHRLEQAKEDLEAGKLLYDKNFYKSANNRAYYSIFHSIKAVLALEPIDFKRHKDVLAYFNKNYINKEIFSRMMGRKIQNASAIREDSDYDDEFIVDADKTNEQLKTAEELIELVDKYIDEN